MRNNSRRIGRLRWPTPLTARPARIPTRGFAVASSPSADGKAVDASLDRRRIEEERRPLARIAKHRADLVLGLRDDALGIDRQPSALVDRGRRCSAAGRRGAAADVVCDAHSRAKVAAASTMRCRGMRVSPLASYVAKLRPHSSADGAACSTTFADISRIVSARMSVASSSRPSVDSSASESPGIARSSSAAPPV